MARKSSAPIGGRELIVILAIIGTLFLVFTNVNSPFAVTSGFQVLSIDKPNFVTGNENLRDLNWRVQVALGGNEQITGTIDPARFEQETGLLSENSFTINAEAIQETLRYSINRDTDRPIYQYSTTQIMDASQSCGSDVYRTIIVDRLLLSDQKFCVKRTLVGFGGDISNPTNTFSADLTISNGQQTIRRTIGNAEESGSVAFIAGGRTIARANWIGNLLTGTALPTITDKAVRTADTNLAWRPVSSTDYNNYYSQQTDLEQAIDSEYFRIVDEGSIADISLTELQDLKQFYDREIDSFESVRQSTINDYVTLSSDFNLQNPTSEFSAFWEYTTNTRLQIPTLTFDIAADWLGIVILSSDPVITDIRSNTFGSEEQGTVLVTVQNQGNEQGVIEANLVGGVCEFQQTTTNPRYNLAAGQSRDFALYIQAPTTTGDISDVCTVCVRDTADPTREDCSDVSVGYTATRVCSPNAYSVDQSSGTVFVCDDQGLSREQVASCASDEVVTYTGEGEYDGYECVSENTPLAPNLPSFGGDTTGDDTSDTSSQNQFAGGVAIFAAILGFAAMLIVIGSTTAWKASKALNVARWILAILAGVVVFIGVGLIAQAVVGLFTFSLF